MATGTFKKIESAQLYLLYVNVHRVQYSMFLIELEFKEKSTEKKPLKPYQNNSFGKIFLLVGRLGGPWIML